MELDQIWAWLGNAIAASGVRWVVGTAALGVSGFLGLRYREMKRRVAALETEASRARITTVIHNHAPIINDPPDRGDVDEIRVMPQSEYDALPVKRERTMYLISSRGQ